MCVKTFVRILLKAIWFCFCLNIFEKCSKMIYCNSMLWTEHFLFLYSSAQTNYAFMHKGLEHLSHFYPKSGYVTKGGKNTAHTNKHCSRTYVLCMCRYVCVFLKAF